MVLLLIANVFCIGYMSYAHHRLSKQEEKIRMLMIHLQASDNILFSILEDGLEHAQAEFKEAKAKHEKFKSLSPEFQNEIIKQILR